MVEKILYISDVNDNESIFHSQVLPHIDALRKKFVVELLILERNSSTERCIKYNSVSGDFIKTIAWVNFKKQKEAVYNSCLKNKFDLIYSRGVRGGLLGSFIKKNIYKNKIKLLNDVRGDALDENSYNIFKELLLKKSIRFVFKNSDMLFFVSSYLKNKYVEEFDYKGETAIFPTFVPDGKFKFDQEARNNIRLELGYTEDDLVVLYSGNLAKWQNLNSIVTAFSKTNNKRLKLLVLTKDKAIKNIIAKETIDSSRIKYFSVPYSNIEDYYSAGDFGILIRDDIPTNQCSAPTKFSEYINSGLVIITTDIKADYVDLLKEKREISAILVKTKDSLKETFDNLNGIKRNTLEINTLNEIVDKQSIVFSKE